MTAGPRTNPVTFEETNGSGGSEVYQEFVSTYIASGTNAGLLSTVTQEYKVGSGSWTTIATTTYTYYSSTIAFGSAGQLETAVTEDAGDNILNASFYLYETGSGVEATVNTAGYEQLVAEYGSSLSSLEYDEIDPYISLVVSYDLGSGQVSQLDDSLGGGLGSEEYNYTYTTNSVAQLSPNAWTMETTLRNSPMATRTSFSRMLSASRC